MDSRRGNKNLFNPQHWFTGLHFNLTEQKCIATNQNTLVYELHHPVPFNTVHLGNTQTPQHTQRRAEATI